MKKRNILFLALFIFSSISSPAQIYKAVYDFKKSDEVSQRYQGKSELYFNKVSSLNKHNLQVAKEKQKSSDLVITYLGSKDTEGFPIYTNIEDEIQVFKTDFLGNLFVVSDSLINMNWEILPEEKLINGYMSIKAKGRFAGRNYVAWFTPELPFSFGPYRYHGLPGLITRIVSEDQSVYIDLISVEKIEELQTDIIQPPKQGEKLNWNEYEEAYFDIIDEHHTRTSSKLKSISDPIELEGKYNLKKKYYSDLDE